MVKRSRLFAIASWATILLGIWVIFGAFDPFILVYGDFWLYLILISGALGIIGAVLTLGIFPIIGGLSISAGMIYLSFNYGLSLPILFNLLRAILLVIGGSGIILTYEMPIDIYSTELIRLNVDKTEYRNLKQLGINNLKDLVEEKGNEEEIGTIASIPSAKLKNWIIKAEQILQEIESMRKEKLEKDYKKRFKNR